MACGELTIAVYPDPILADIAELARTDKQFRSKLFGLMDAKHALEGHSFDNRTITVHSSDELLEEFYRTKAKGFDFKAFKLRGDGEK